MEVLQADCQKKVEGEIGIDIAAVDQRGAGVGGWGDVVLVLFFPFLVLLYPLVECFALVEAVRLVLVPHCEEETQLLFGQARPGRKLRAHDLGVDPFDAATRASCYGGAVPLHDGVEKRMRRSNARRKVEIRENSTCCRTSLRKR